MSRLWFFVFLLFAGATRATPEFRFEVSEAALKPVRFEFHEKATRTWLPGCGQPDLVQGGWIPVSARYDQIPQSIAPNLFQVRVQRGFFRTLWVKLCAARFDEQNFVRLEHGLSPATRRFAAFQIDPRGSAMDATSVCALTPNTPASASEPLGCSRPSLKTQGTGTVFVRIVWQE